MGRMERRRDQSTSCCSRPLGCTENHYCTHKSAEESAVNLVAFRDFAAPALVGGVGACATFARKSPRLYSKRAEPPERHNQYMDTAVPQGPFSRFQRHCQSFHWRQRHGLCRPMCILLFVLTLQLSQAKAATFTTKAIGQSTPVPGAINTFTITLVPDANLTATNSSVVTISGFSGAVATSSIVLIDAGDDGELMFSDGKLHGRGAWNSSGTLTLYVNAGHMLTSGTTYTFAFSIQNPILEQSAATINVAATGTASFASATMSTPGTTLYGVLNGSDPLRVVIPSFRTKSIKQSTPVSGALNILTATLTANYDLAANSTVTISGLTGSQTRNNGTLTVASTNGLLGSSGAWTQGSGELVLTAASGGMTAATECVVTFALENTASDQASPEVSVAAAIEDGSGVSVGSIAQAAMVKPNAALYGVANGANPLTVRVPSFGHVSIAQSTPVSGALNTLTATLTVNYDLAANSTVTISGLMGSQTTDASIAVTSTSSLFGIVGAWTKDLGELVLTAASGGMTAATKCVVTFSLTNAATEHESPSVRIQALILHSEGSVGSIRNVAMTKPSTPLFGVANGSAPLTVAVPNFTVKSIRQSTSAPGAVNGITITLVANYNLGDGSTVTISGLEGSQTTNEASLPVTSTSNTLGTTGAWTQQSGQLVLTVASGGTDAGTAYTVTFRLINAATDKVSPLVSINASILHSRSPLGKIFDSAMTKPGVAMCGVENGADPLTVLVQLSCEAGMFPGDTQCETCPRGYFCNMNSTNPMPCPAGTTGRTAGLASVSQCMGCPSGFIALSAGSTNCTACPAGYNCPTPSSLANQCNQGHYSLLGQASCAICPAGYGCTIPSDAPIRCQEGYFSKAGAAACELCEAGKFCPVDPAGSPPVSCPDGEYSSNGKTSCTSCSPGYYAVARISDNCTLSSGRVNCTRCPAGHSCEQFGEKLLFVYLS